MGRVPVLIIILAPSRLRSGIQVITDLIHPPLTRMESVVPPEITAELTQILANLVLGDNEIRSKYVVRVTTPCAKRTDNAPTSEQRRQSMTVLHIHQIFICSHWPSLPLQQIQKWRVTQTLIAVADDHILNMTDALFLARSSPAASLPRASPAPSYPHPHPKRPAHNTL